jgi:hypothetical protein
MHIQIYYQQQLLHLQLYFTNLKEMVESECGVESHWLFTDVTGVRVNSIHQTLQLKNSDSKKERKCT